MAIKKPKLMNLTAKQFRSQVGPKLARAVAEHAGTSYAYFKHICQDRKRPSPELADKLVKASQELTPHAVMGYLELLPVKYS